VQFKVSELRIAADLCPSETKFGS